MKRFLFLLLLLITAACTPKETPKVPGVVISHMPQAEGKYVGSPGLCVLPDGTYVASHDEFGPKSSEFRSAQTRVFHSLDKGESWEQIATIDGQFWSNLFVHNGGLYMMGVNKHHGNLIIRKSEDGGRTWTTPYLPTNGLILEGEYHTAPMPMLIHSGRIWRAVEYATGPSSDWGERYNPMVVSAPVDADLLNAANWQKTDYIAYDRNYLDSTLLAMIEGNMVVSPEGELLDILRVNTAGTKEEYAAFVHIDAEGKHVSLDPEKDFHFFPGGAKKFTIRYDEPSGRYWMLTNYITPEWKEPWPGSVRNCQALCSSENLTDWTIHEIALYYPEQVFHGFQYVEWLVDGDDIIFASRTAFDDGQGGARNNHDANFLTFHRIENFRELVGEKRRIIVIKAKVKTPIPESGWGF